MSKNWKSWWIITISLNVLIISLNPELRHMVTLNSVWSMLTVGCLWARRTDAHGNDIEEDI